MTDVLAETAGRLQTKILDLIERSSIKIGRSHGRVVWVGPNSWTALDTEGRQLQAQILSELERYQSIVETLIRSAPERMRDAVRKAGEQIMSAVDQSSGTWHSTIDEVRREVVAAFEVQAEALRSLHDPSDGEPIYVPDANAIIHNPDLEQWEFPETPRFTLLLTPTLLSELDDLKAPYRPAELRTKAEGAIRRIKEYARRGDPHEGVTLVGGRSTVRMAAIEPDFTATLAWLDPAVKDDRLIASTIEIIRAHPRSPVTMVTLDVNVQNKARLARIPWVEPPDPAERPERPQPPPPVKILGDIVPQGGADGRIRFTCEIQNTSTSPVRATLRASVDDEPVECHPPQVDLLANVHPTPITIVVPRPQLGDLVPEFNHAPTLYGRTLTAVVEVDGREASAQWVEDVYDEAENATRATIQAQLWRVGRGEGTEADEIAARQRELLRLHRERAS